MKVLGIIKYCVSACITIALFFGLIPVLPRAEIAQATGAGIAKSTWRAALLVYESIDYVYKYQDGATTRHMNKTMSTEELNRGINSFINFADTLAYRESAGNVTIDYDIIYVDHPLNQMAEGFDSGSNLWKYWAAPWELEDDINQYAPQDEYDSIFVYYTSCDYSYAENPCIPGYGWGLSYPPDTVPETNGAGYSTVHSAPGYWWGDPYSINDGEVWLHEWIHQVSPFFEDLGYPQPPSNSDGAELNGYTQSNTRGYLDYYSDILTNQVMVDDDPTGIPTPAWRSQSPTKIGPTTTLAAPTYLPNGGSFTAPSLSVQLGGTADDATIRYTTDGSTPTCSTGTAGSIATISASATIKSIACGTHYLDSSVSSQDFTVTPVGVGFPTVSLTAPSASATISGNATISASASDSGGSIAGVTFKIDNVTVDYEDTTAPYSISYDTTETLVDGTHLITASARDNEGNVSTTAATIVTVSNPTVVDKLINFSAVGVPDENIDTFTLTVLDAQDGYLVLPTTTSSRNIRLEFTPQPVTFIISVPGYIANYVVSADSHALDEINFGALLAGDTDDNAIIDATDLLYVRGAWGGNNAYDYIDDDVINAIDYSFILRNYGAFSDVIYE